MAATATKADITIYSTTWCGFCKKEKEYLDEKGIAYTDIMVDLDPAKAQEMIDLSHQMGVPFTVIKQEGKDDVHILGFDKPKIDEALGLA